MDSTNLESKLLSIDNIFTQFEDVCDGHAKEIRNSTCSYTAEKITNHLTAMQNTDRLLKIGIIGRVKAGKSSLINALLFNGRDVLPKAATPMTAALTTIGHSKQFTATVEFFSQDDLTSLREKALRYQTELQSAVQEQIEEAQRRQQKRLMPGQSAPAIDEERLRSMASRQLDDREPTLKSAADLHERIKKSNVDIHSLRESKVLQASSEAELNKELYEYVGSEGKFMPFTRSLHIGLPLGSLNDMLVVDTPGLNDAVASREQRTYDMLKECNVVFIVSPAGQFLNAQDLELAGRLTKREGIQEIFVVASQVDTQLHSSERQKHQGQLPLVIEGLQGILAQQSASTLRNQDNEVLSAVADQQHERLFVTSGICQTLLAQPEQQWDDTAKHTLSLLKRNYADYFTTSEQQQVYLKMLAGREPLLNTIDTVRHKKNDILAKQAQDFIRAQEQSVTEVAIKLTDYFTTEIEKITNADLHTVEQDLQQLETVRSAGKNTANNLFKDHAEEFELLLADELRSLLKQFRSEIRGDMESAEGTVTETYKREKRGATSWLARKLWGGGHETVNETLTTLDARSVRAALEDMYRFIQDGLLDVAQHRLLLWRKKLTMELISKLRETIGDDRVDADKLASVCRTAINSMQDLPQPTLPELPAELAKSGKLKGYKAEEYIEQAGNYLSLLLTEADNYADQIRTATKGLSGFDMGGKLFDSLQQEMMQLRDMVENKRLTIDKMNTVLQRLREVAA
ncbi:dynamin family protein [Oceanisphaera sp.]|uniref:dynamin family protein n=1 Tax=Oceanisphaera sp. TaxID=1929979 RepID=UPI003A9562BE